MSDKQNDPLKTRPEQSDKAELTKLGTEYIPRTRADDPSKSRQELLDEADITEQDTEYVAHTIPPLGERVRHWHHWRTAGLVCALAGIFLIIGGHFGASGRAMQIGGFVILAGAVIFTVGVIGGWVTRQRPLD